MRPRVYVASRLRAQDPIERQRNHDLVRLACAHATTQGVRPFAPHLLYPAWLNPQDPGQDAAGIEMAMADLAECAQLWFYLDHRGFSQGMKAERKAWREACGAKPRGWVLSDSLEPWLGAWPLAFDRRGPVLEGVGSTRLSVPLSECFRAVDLGVQI